MIRQIEEINFGPGTSHDYATLSNATVQLSEMGDRIITTQVKIDGDIIPDFDGWELRFRGERFVLNVKDPQAAKDNTSINSIIDLTFYSWPTLQLKRYFMFTVPATATGVITADKYNASVALPLQDFSTLLGQVLEYYFHGKIYVDLAPGTTSDIAAWEINYTHIWDVVQKIYEIYGVRWRMEYNSDTDSYAIKIGYPALEIDDHEFRYGYEGGLMRFERQVQNGDITNIILGRGGTRNVPYRYFKRVDEQNPEWTPDPDAIPELANLYLDRIRDINFRRYVQGWITSARYASEYESGSGYAEPRQYDEVRAATDWAYAKGHSDTSFEPVEYVKDDESILKYGEHWGHLDDDDDIYPTIQGIEIGGGRADLVVAVSEITTDEIGASTAAAANIVDLSNGVVNQTNDIEQTASDMDLQYEQIMGDRFTVPAGMTANLQYNDFFLTADTQRSILARMAVVTDRSRVAVFRANDDVEVPSKGLSPGEYYYVIYVAIRNVSGTIVPNATYGVNGLRLEQSASGSGDEWKPTFDIWIRNIFETGIQQGESPEDYALRVWGPVLGDHLGNEASVAFSDGQMSISEDYDFKIAAYPEFDQSKTLNGLRSEWKITLYKTDAEFDATGLFVPNATTGGRPIAGDHFYFLGIDMPNFYVVEAERRVNYKKIEALFTSADISPTWVVDLDKVRMDDEYNEGQEKLFDKIEAGVKMYVSDKRFTKDRPLALFASSVTFTWADGTVILPQVEVVLTDKIAVSKSQIAQMQGDISALRSSVAQMSDTTGIIRESIKPLFLGKTGEEETSLSPTKFASLVTSEDFQQGGFGGRGWGFYRDNSMTYQNIEQVAAPQRRMLMAAGPLRAGAVEEEAVTEAVPSIRAGSQAVLEVDRLIVRRDMQVNNLVVNQIAYVGGKQIISAAAIECVQVVENDGSYDCFFDQKQGSVKNLFQVDDIAMGQVFTAENTELRFYKCVVTEVGLDYIRLSKTQKYGTGVPKKGDVIVQYGNISNKGRQYAIVRDVVGGGYERMISDLDSIYNDGEEYYFAGLSQGDGSDVDLADNQDRLIADSDDKVLTVKQGAKPRFFVGNADSNIDFNSRDGILRLKGNIVQSPSGVEFPVPCFVGEYDEEQWYYYGDLVTYNGSSWIHIGKNRTKGTTPEDGNIWKLYAESGKPIIYGDLDNEMDAIGVGSDGILDVAVPYANALSTKLTISYGTAAQPLTALTVSGVPTGISYERVQVNGAYTGQVKFWAPTAPVDLSAGRYPITITGTVFLDNRNVQYSCVYTLLGSKQGADGATFILVPNINSVKKTAAGSISDAYITCTATDSAGNELNTYYIYYSRDGGSRALYKQRVNGGTPTYGSGLSNGIPTNNIETNVKLYLYLTSSDVSSHKYVDTETIPLIIDGANGANGVAVFRWNQSATQAPSISGTAYPPSGWSKSAPDRPGDGYYLWMSTGNQISANAVDAWSTPVRISGDQGTAGEDAADMEWIYYLSASDSYGTAPANITKDNGGVQRNAEYIATHDDFVPLGWTDNPQGVSIAKKYEFSAFRQKDRGAERWGAFSTPILWSHYGQRGIDGDGVEYVYARTKANVAPAVPTSGQYSEASQGYNVDEHLPYVRVSSSYEISGSTDPVTSGGYKYVKCTDDPVGIDNEWQYEWVLKRNKKAPGTEGTASEGVRDWNPYSGSMSLWAKNGEKGSTGRIMRGVTEWATGKTYQGFNDDYDASTENIFYDVVWIPDPNDATKKLYYYCTEGHTSSNSNKPGTSGVNSKWNAASQFDFVATRVFLAENAQIDFLTGNDILVRDGNNIVAGMLGGTGVNFFAGSTKDNAANAPFRVDNQGNLVATKATINGKIITGAEAAQQGSYDGASMVSLNGLFVNAGGATVSSGNVNVAAGTLHATSTADNSEHYLDAKYGQKEGKVTASSASGRVNLLAKDSTHSVEVDLLQGDVQVKRGSGNYESIVTSPTVKHHITISESDFEELSDAEKNDATKMYYII